SGREGSGREGSGREGSGREGGGGRGREGSRVLVVALFCVAAYVGYFGAAGGILMLAVLTPMLAEPMARANAVKNVISGLANAVAAMAFAVLGHVDWAAVGPLAAGFLLGGWTGPALVRRVPGRVLRVLVGVCGIGVGVKLGISAYG
ncbi:MAG TPA: sulfite exporter TauE/SafE family protein, partial [Streptosporangiaceae bacterium]